MQFEYSQTIRGQAVTGFRPGWWPSIAVALLLPLLLGLGFWQLSRAEEKRALLADFAAREHAEPMSVAELERRADLAHLRIRLRGQFDEQHSLLLDNRQRGGKVGVELLQPFYDQSSGLWLLVNRGWLPWPDRRQAVQFSTPESELDLTAWVYRSPGEPLQLAATPSRDWPRLINRVEARALWSELGRAGWPYELRLNPGPAAYAVDWPIVAMGPEKHLGYAVQWFALGLALTLLYGYLGWRRAQELAHVAQSDSV